MKRLCLFLLICAAGCAEHVDMHVDSAPRGAGVHYRVGTESGPPRTAWHYVGQTPFQQSVVVPPFWSDPGSTLELRVGLPGYRPAEKSWEPASVRTDGSRLQHNFVLEAEASR